MTPITTKRQIYLLNEVVCFVLFGLVCQAEISQTIELHVCPLDISEKKFLMSKGAPSWFETVWSYGVEAIDY
jgi:hypothetical protein